MVHRVEGDKSLSNYSLDKIIKNALICLFWTRKPKNTPIKWGIL